MTSRIFIVLRILIILTFGYGSLYLILDTDFWLAGIWIGMFAIIGIINLVFYMERSKRELFNFLSAIKQGDFTQTKSMTRSVWENDKLNEVYKEIQNVFLKLNAEKASHYLFLQTILEHVEIAMVAFNEKGEIAIANKEVTKLFGMPHFRTIKKLFRSEPELFHKILEKGHEKFVYKKNTNGSLSILSVNVTNFSLDQIKYKLVSFQDIRPELEEKELDSWQKLIRILTHEIMNSTIPISTMAGVIAKMIVDEKGEVKKSLDEETKNDVYGGLKTIENRSKGLSSFVDSYRSLTKIKPPKFEIVSSTLLINDVLNLLKGKLNNKKIKLIKKTVEINLNIDKELISQVIINLMLNAIDALEDKINAEITISIKSKKHLTIIDISDNGTGIELETLEDIFVPFYTTKEEGSGIGLSITKQILRLHKGKISVQSELGIGTTFSIEL